MPGPRPSLRASSSSSSVVAVAAALLLVACGPAPSNGDVARATEALTVCAGANTVPGIDVSYYQGAIDWAAVSAAGYRFAIARISDGLAHPDVRFAENWAGMGSAGVVRGAYQYFEPAVDPAAQAALVVASVGRLSPLDLPVTLDAEVQGDVDAASLVASYRVWLDAVEAGTGKRPIVYTAPYFWNALGSDSLGGLDLWAASPSRDCPELPTTWTHWSLWQKGTSNVPGIQATTDVDEFNGSMQDLLTFTDGRPRTQAAKLDGGAPVASAAHTYDRARPSPLDVRDGGSDADDAGSRDGGDDARTEGSFAEARTADATTTSTRPDGGTPSYADVIPGKPTFACSITALSSAGTPQFRDALCAAAALLLALRRLRRDGAAPPQETPLAEAWSSSSRSSTTPENFLRFSSFIPIRRRWAARIVWSESSRDGETVGMGSPPGAGVDSVRISNTSSRAMLCSTWLISLRGETMDARLRFFSASSTAMRAISPRFVLSMASTSERSTTTSSPSKRSSSVSTKRLMEGASG
ncbi:MAG TPA: GH25 family lysozyme [Polyangiaceae bacterium]|jgi:lysozyme|nr:GH25 family lysozyme [Polyangiaceae bacterium]